MTARYFLTKPNSNGKPEFDEEMPDENQAMIEALKRDRHFVTSRNGGPKWTSAPARR